MVVVVVFYQQVSFVLVSVFVAVTVTLRMRACTATVSNNLSNVIMEHISFSTQYETAGHLSTDMDRGPLTSIWNCIGRVLSGVCCKCAIKQIWIGVKALIVLNNACVGRIKQIAVPQKCLPSGCSFLGKIQLFLNFWLELNIQLTSQNRYYWQQHQEVEHMLFHRHGPSRY